MNEPSCYGLPSVYNAQGATCIACPHRVNCVAEIKVLLRSMQPVGAPAFVPATLTGGDDQAPVQFDLRAGKKVQWGLTDTQKSTLAKLPKKVGIRYSAMIKSGFSRQVGISLAKRVNPFNEVGSKFLAVACDKLLAGGTTKAQLRKDFQTSFGWSENTAASHVSVCVALLPALGAATVTGDRLLLSPTTTGQTAL